VFDYQSLHSFDLLDEHGRFYFFGLALVWLPRFYLLQHLPVADVDFIFYFASQSRVFVADQNVICVNMAEIVAAADVLDQFGFVLDAWDSLPAR
jgi:hypothetical protein